MAWAPLDRAQGLGWANEIVSWPCSSSHSPHKDSRKLVTGSLDKSDLFHLNLVWIECLKLIPEFHVYFCLNPFYNSLSPLFPNCKTLMNCSFVPYFLSDQYQLYTVWKQFNKHQRVQVGIRKSIMQESSVSKEHIKLPFIGQKHWCDLYFSVQPSVSPQHLLGWQWNPLNIYWSCLTGCYFAVQCPVFLSAVLKKIETLASSGFAESPSGLEHKQRLKCQPALLSCRSPISATSIRLSTQFPHFKHRDVNNTSLPEFSEVWMHGEPGAHRDALCDYHYGNFLWEMMLNPEHFTPLFHQMITIRSAEHFVRDQHHTLGNSF